jgi:hypothetical protein
MSNPDTTETGANIGGIAILGSFIVILVIILFNYHQSSAFYFLLYGGLPIIIYILMFVVLYISKKNTDVKNAFLSAVPTIGTTYLALFISYISFFRIPVASVFAPMFIGSTANIVSQPVSGNASNAKSANASNANASNANASNANASNANASNANAKNATAPSAPLPQVISRGGSYKKLKKQTGGSCCSPTLSLDGIETQFPTVKGISYAFYIFFAICFGGVFGSSIPTV